MVEILGPLSARPPTPPRTSSRMLSENDRTEDSPVVVHTPRDSPFSVNGSTGAPSSRQSKRVNFSPWTRYIKPPSFTNSAAKSKSDLKSLPPSNECKPTKSILKPTTSHSAANSPSAEPQAPISFAMLLESILQQLAGEAVSSRLDAYMQFFGALRAYDNLPGDQEIIARLGLITQFIQRDVSRDLTTGGPLHTNLVIQALKLAVALVWHSEISARLPDDFKTFLVDHSVNCLQDVKMPKSVVTHYLSVLSTQNFNAKVMTNTRILRILTVLHELTNRVTGSAIVSQRLSIYLRVLNQSKMIFVSNASLWMDHLISGLLHHVKDIRIKAISVGFQTAIACGPNPTLSKCVREVFSRPLDERRKLVTEVCERMTRMMALADCGVHIPQIWSVIILLLRSKKFNVDQWEHFKEWVLVLQRCFNCSDSAIKAQAIVGWNRFVYVVGPSDTTSPSLLRMLSKPIVSQFDRKKQDKQPSQLALCSYYNLLYYAFRPSASFQHLDVVWEEYVVSPASSIFSSVPSLSDRVAHVLSNMLWSPQAKVWLENKVNESNKLDPEELPSIDSRWIRSRITSVLSVFEEIFKSSVWNPDIERSNIATAWIGLSKALSHASSKEITPTPESMQAVAHVLGLLQRLWNAGPSSLNAAIEKDSADAFYDRFSFLSTTMIYSLGGARFTEKLLLKTADETFQAATTPTHRHQKANTSLDSPILHFLRFISELPGHSGPSPSYTRLVTRVLEATCSDKLSRSSRLEFLSQCADIHVFDAAAHVGDDRLAETVWKSVAQLSASSLSSFPMETARERDGSVCRDYENIVNILSAGLKFSDVFEVWNPLVDSLIRVVRTEKGDRAIATMAVEPLAGSIIEQGTRNTCTPSASLLRLSLSIPYCHEAETVKGTHETTFPHKLFELVDKTLRQSYESFDPVKPNGIADFIECLTSLLGSGVPTFRTAMLTHLQQSLAFYLKDGERKINAESGVESRILTAVSVRSKGLMLHTNSELVIPVDTSVKSRIAFILDDPFTLGLNSSPITGGSEHSDPDMATDHPIPLPTGSGDPRKRSELFSIIESLRSSSPPTNTPRELGFMTPPHLRDLRNADADAGTPQTPTLPPVATDNEYGFLGSSPTPGTRSRTQLSEPEIPQSLSTPAAEDSAIENELQSSPPKPKSTSPDPQSNTGNMNTPGSANTTSSKNRRSKRRARRSSRQKKAMNAQSRQPEPTGESMTVDSEEPLIKRLPSLEHQASAEQPKDSESQQIDGCDYIADSCSDDMETQVASQLEQDLELAVDLDDAASIEYAATAPEQGANKKRKREAEQSTPSGKERRRSSRLTKTPSVADVEGGRATRSKRPINASQDVDSSPAESAPKRRKTDSKSDIIGTSKPAEQAASTDSGKTKVQDTQESSQKRRSSRLSGQAAPAIPEESPLPKKSPRPSRSRKSTKDKAKDSIQEEAELQRETPIKDVEPKTTVEDKPTEQLPEPDSSVQPTTEAQLDEPMDEPVPESQQTAPDDVQMEDAPVTEPIFEKTPSEEKEMEEGKKMRAVSRTTQTESQKEPEITEAEITDSLRKVLSDMKLAKLDRNSLKEIDDLLFDIRVETHEALRRNTS
ncbi:hypothetical protein ASPNIDRAFT_44054 [Aspergillus niger ATCC 1015]|uniref:Telomere-associated protein Rif1 N-terminal domain-containing protein n=1 Tax=Aspergillus niger (strain ATCC 1015 / CBS 113.46 / FGSC A1144 / LSHB Ac4 / NCTC 3858a / NRRL 328 / USDA 3528.7) TaxID=380704 RepID=G3Y910_ASPNA|nr:hypothetical protein ASPNIDRAFT_44054 [Aspergillus niger ATCC 1015]